ncbi:MAG: GspH/FimT family pseudopilin [Betaproteobacteria bacterium]
MLKTAQAGVSLIELMVGLAIAAFLLFLGVPEFANFLQNTQIRNAAETTLAGMTLAKAEAVRRNAPVRFQLVSDLTAGCTVSGAALSNSTALSWVVSLENPAGACNVAPSDTAPQIVQKKSAAEGSRNVLVSTTGAPTLTFNGLGRVSGAGGLQRLDFRSASGVCVHVDDVNGTMRCLAIMVTSGGSIKMCDPKVGDVTDPRHCS